MSINTIKSFLPKTSNYLQWHALDNNNKGKDLAGVVDNHIEKLLVGLANQTKEQLKETDSNLFMSVWGMSGKPDCVLIRSCTVNEDFATLAKEGDTELLTGLSAVFHVIAIKGLVQKEFSLLYETVIDVVNGYMAAPVESKRCHIDALVEFMGGDENHLCAIKHRAEAMGYDLAYGKYNNQCL